LNKTAEMERGISELVGCLTDPIIVFPGGWGDTLPEWLKNAITLERLIMNMRALEGEEMTATDAEACAYLYTAALSQPMDHDWGQIYLYTATKVYERWRTRDSKVKVPADIRVETLNDYQQQELRRLKDWIYRSRIGVRQERDRAERRAKKEQKKSEQLHFNF